jgi:FADH2 O2-dependent halogenase
MLSSLDKEYDCLVIGSGIAGSISALCMAQCQIKTLVVEEKSHPRFAIGESTVPTTSFGLYRLSKTYRVPELRLISHYLGLKQLGCTAWPKQSFHFAVHQDGVPLPRGHEAMLVTLPLPIGPDVHMLRADVDGLLVSRFPAYGVDYTDHTSVVGLEHDSRGVTITLAQGAETRAVRARFVLDCSGHQSFLAKRYQLRDSDSRLKTNTRTIFSHFTGIPPLDDVLGSRCPEFGRIRDTATIHHCFEGGWIWVIRFDSGVVSVGVTLDREVYPDNDRPAEEEFRAFIARFPTVHAHLGRAEAIRPYTKTGRIQFSSRTTVGERFMLSPHAAGFVDPLFSSGINLTQAFITRFVPEIRKAMKEDDFRPERFTPIDRAYQDELDTIDQIVHGMFKAYRHFDVFKQFWRCWVYATAAQDVCRIAYDPTSCDGPTRLYGAGLPKWRRHLTAMHETLVARHRDDPQDVAHQLKALMDSVPELFLRANWEIGSDTACRPLLPPPPHMFRWLDQLAEVDGGMAASRRRNFAKFALRALGGTVGMWAKYGMSKMAGAPTYPDGVDLIRSHQYRIGSS